MNVTVRNQIPASDVDPRIISLQIFRDWKLQTRKFTGTPKIRKLVRIYFKNGQDAEKQYR